MTAPRRTFLAARTGTADLGFEAATVSRVVLRTDWEGPEPADVEQLLQAEPPRERCRHVLVIQGPGGPCIVGTRRELVLRDCSSSELHELPALLWGPGSQPMLRSISLVSNAPPLLILDREALETRLVAWQRQGEFR